MRANIGWLESEARTESESRTALLRAANMNFEGISVTLWNSIEGVAPSELTHSLPTRNEEDDKLDADGRYRAAIADVIEQTMGKIPLVFEESKNYGYECNLLGMQPICL